MKRLILLVVCLAGMAMAFGRSGPGAQSPGNPQNNGTANSQFLFSHIDTVLLRVTDLERSRVWFEQKLGFRASYVSKTEGFVVFDVGGKTGLTIWQLKPGERLPPSDTAVAYPIFFSEDARKTHAELRSRGVGVEEIHEDLRSRYFTFYDPDRNHLEVCQWW